MVRPPSERLGRALYSTLRGQVMLEPGTEIEMTKGYKGVKGTVMERTESEFEFYILKLDNGIQLVAGPTAFIPLEKEKGQ